MSRKSLGRQVRELMDLESLESELESKAVRNRRDQHETSGLSSMQLKRKQHGHHAKADGGATSDWW